MAGTGPTGGSGEAGNGSARSPAGRETSGPQTAQEGKGRKERPKRDQAAGKQQENFILVGWEGGSGSVGGQERAAEMSCPVSVPVSQGSSIEIPVSGMRINNSLILSFLGWLGCFGCLGQSRRPTELLGLRSNTPRQHSERHPMVSLRTLMLRDQVIRPVHYRIDPIHSSIWAGIPKRSLSSSLGIFGSISVSKFSGRVGGKKILSS